MKGIRHIYQVGSPHSRREKSTGEGNIEGSCRTNGQDDRAQLRSSLMSMTASSISPDIAPVVSQHRAVTPHRSLSGIALLLPVSIIEEPVGCAVGQTITDGRRRKGSDGPRPSLRTGHRVIEERSRT